ncbi:hypothetical protein TREES_T100013407 [Tupaia chinensis]|uniref:Uncharacterized protein n=1 Tax=Tupaia chinensis TaxID=246437 RepID=L9JBG0_TUPCH|nr:hypothetical protein TREES_T100013407 [Tupaia chinensis]
MAVSAAFEQGRQKGPGPCGWSHPSSVLQGTGPEGRGGPQSALCPAVKQAWVPGAVQSRVTVTVAGEGLPLRSGSPSGPFGTQTPDQEHPSCGLPLVHTF